MYDEAIWKILAQFDLDRVAATFAQTTGQSLVKGFMKKWSCFFFHVKVQAVSTLGEKIQSDVAQDMTPCREPREINTRILQTVLCEL